MCLALGLLVSVESAARLIPTADGAQQLAGFPVFSQPDDISCGPTCCSMVLRYYGIDAGIEPLKTRCGTRWLEAGGYRFGMTFPAGIQAGLWAYGLRASLRESASLQDVMRLIDAGRPPILLVRSGADTWHYIVVVGYDRDYLRIADPGDGQICTYSSAAIAGGWQFSNSYTGAKVRARCQICAGSGRVNAPNPNLQCLACDGSGKTRFGKCRVCGGSGRLRGELPKVKCVACGGSGEADLYRKAVESAGVRGNTLIVPDAPPRHVAGGGSTPAPGDPTMPPSQPNGPGTSSLSRTMSLQNLGTGQFQSWYLDIDGDSGKVILSPRPSSGTHWRLTPDGENHRLQNVGKSSFRGWYLDIDGNTGAAILSANPRASGTLWRLSDDGGGLRLQNMSNGRFRGWYLDIDGRQGSLTLTNKRHASGNRWRASGA